MPLLLHFITMVEFANRVNCVHYAQLLRQTVLLAIIVRTMECLYQAHSVYLATIAQRELMPTI